MMQIFTRFYYRLWPPHCAIAIIKYRVHGPFARTINENACARARDSSLTHNTFVGVFNNKIAVHRANFEATAGGGGLERVEL